VSDEAEKPAWTAKRKETKPEPFIDNGTLDTFTVARITSMWQYSSDTIQRWLKMNLASKLAVTRIVEANENA
jgi:hypothetical protein